MKDIEKIWTEVPQSKEHNYNNKISLKPLIGQSGLKLGIYKLFKIKIQRITVKLTLNIENDVEAVQKEDEISKIWQVVNTMVFQSILPLTSKAASRTAWAKKTTMTQKNQGMEKLWTYLHFINTGKISKVAWTIVSSVHKAKDQDAIHLLTVLEARKDKLANVWTVTHQLLVSIVLRNVEVILTYRLIWKYKSI